MLNFDLKQDSYNNVLPSSGNINICDLCAQNYYFPRGQSLFQIWLTELKVELLAAVCKNLTKYVILSKSIGRVMKWLYIVS